MSILCALICSKLELNWYGACIVLGMNYLAALALIGSSDFNSIFNCILTIESGNRVDIVSKTGDYGIGQINKRSWPRFDYSRMLNDRDYSVASAKQVLVYTESKVGHKPGWPCAYNVGLTAFRLGNKPTACKVYNIKLAKCLSIKGALNVK